MLLTTEKGKEITKNITEKMSREEIDRLIEHLKQKRAAASGFDVDIDEDDFSTEM